MSTPSRLTSPDSTPQNACFAPSVLPINLVATLHRVCLCRSNAGRVHGEYRREKSKAFIARDEVPVFRGCPCELSMPTLGSAEFDVKHRRCHRIPSQAIESAMFAIRSAAVDQCYVLEDNSWFYSWNRGEGSKLRRKKVACGYFDDTHTSINMSTISNV
ncbi:hypothetical protein P153DRAFT_29687 [Dothidotthia symphoricarpi CBS 119687]|uniref:Uncharacterized protein n=1 Tax=Dothidotthia symphoricarpi CBS 119687 TaxID=1392245 RepID=A0A6A6AD04_9PLEO|nr:uncharacterized protein P153DRAFT_29687 [Dothidotthia symphoricarpi CBS 119687]KAF2129005.1 hypothetical protein P153DRAFT_29687 [Dothidotthia symphoricarpi CBS 119687]